MKAKSLTKLLSYYIALQVIVLTICLFIPQFFGADLYGAHVYIYLFVIGTLFYLFSIGVNILFSVLLLFYFSKRNAILLVISLLMSIVFNPYLQWYFFDDQIAKLYDFGVDQQLICKDYDQMVRIMGNPFGTKTFESGEKRFYYYPKFLWILDDGLSITIENGTVTYISTKGWIEKKKESVQKMREQQKACNKLQIKE